MSHRAPTAPIDGLRDDTVDEARTDLLRPLKNTSQSIDFVKVLLWIVAAGIIGSIVYLPRWSAPATSPCSRRPARRTRSLGGGLALQAVRPLDRRRGARAVIAILLAPLFPLPVEIPTSAYLFLFAIAIVVGLLASLAGLRRAVKVEPALAFGG